ncbi:MAG: hypothetical protein LBK68_02025 [Candidatus Margulisbacteria bacterium]|jgi:hypothetical protein|nr:hypothetical protein [Candidatus Margulisiibacteriota bacterium]
MYRKIINYLLSEDEIVFEKDSAGNITEKTKTGFINSVYTGLLGDISYLQNGEKYIQEIKEKDLAKIKTAEDIRLEILDRTTKLSLGLISPLLKKHGLTGKEMLISRHALRKALGNAGKGSHNHKISKANIYRIASLLNNPLAILREPISKAEQALYPGSDFYPDRFLLVLNALDEDYKQVVVPVRLPNETSEYAFIPTTYGYECSTLLNLAQRNEALVYPQDNFPPNMFLQDLATKRAIGNMAHGFGSTEHENITAQLLLTEQEKQEIRDILNQRLSETQKLEDLAEEYSLTFVERHGNRGVYAIHQPLGKKDVTVFFIWKFTNIINGQGSVIKNNTKKIWCAFTLETIASVENEIKNFLSRN